MFPLLLHALKSLNLALDKFVSMRYIITGAGNRIRGAWTWSKIMCAAMIYTLI